MNSKQVGYRIIDLILAGIVSLISVAVFAHGNDVPKMGVAKPKEIARTKVTVPAVLTESEVVRLASLKVVPNDILLVRCHLALMSYCRGFDVEINGNNGLKLVSNTGAAGIVGFQGLDPEQSYQIEIQNRKYLGKTSSYSGKLANLTAQRNISGAEQLK